MIDEKVNRIIKELVEDLKSKYSDFKGIYLFGSHARGEATEESDIDLAIIFDKDINWLFKDEISNYIWLKMVNYIIPIDSFTLSLKDIYFPKTPLRENIHNQGVYYGI
ncbi:MAG: nucleotidyltransferase domain-containing protein [Bacteroidetes bacterium]|nr:nucleotidyltransferase domain-containing protein [Bacteroidota bacterium]